MKKQMRTAKEPVRIRTKELKNGNQSIYLDYYHAGRREYEFLHLYIIPERTPLDKEQNKTTWSIARTIQAQRVTELANGAAGIKRERKGDILLTDYLHNHYLTLAKLRPSTQKLTSLMIDKVTEYGGDKLMLRDVDVDFCKGFIDYLLTSKNKYTGAPLTKRSADIYYTRFVFAINEAVRNGYLTNNPLQRLTMTDKITPETSTREYLTIDEVKALINTDCKHTDLKRAFLFSCFCGLRLSDIRTLRWKDIEYSKDGSARVTIVQQKTNEPLYLDLSEEALKWMPSDRGGDNELIYNLGCCSMISHNISIWSIAAGIKKHVTFHVARHTFATMLLTLGGDLYTVSKLLGHTNIQTTQIYAKIIDQKRRDTANLVNGIF